MCMLQKNNLVFSVGFDSLTPHACHDCGVKAIQPVRAERSRRKLLSREHVDAGCVTLNFNRCFWTTEGTRSCSVNDLDLINWVPATRKTRVLSSINLGCHSLICQRVNNICLNKQVSKCSTLIPENGGVTIQGRLFRSPFCAACNIVDGGDRHRSLRDLFLAALDGHIVPVFPKWFQFVLSLLIFQDFAPKQMSSRQPLNCPNSQPKSSSSFCFWFSRSLRSLRSSRRILGRFWWIHHADEMVKFWPTFSYNFSCVFTMTSGLVLGLLRVMRLVLWLMRLRLRLLASWIVSELGACGSQLVVDAHLPLYPLVNM